MVDPAAIDPATGLVNGVHADYRRMVETAGGQEIAEAARVRFSGIREEDPEESLLSASLMANESAWAQMPSLSLRPPSSEGQHGDENMMQLIIEEKQDEQGQLNRLVRRAKALNHPGMPANSLLLSWHILTGGLQSLEFNCRSSDDGTVLSWVFVVFEQVLMTKESPPCRNISTRNGSHTATTSTCGRNG
eukprot:COSAG02_NODE_5180_length_4567_cov_99.849821_5_plen_190_part_00